MTDLLGIDPIPGDTRALCAAKLNVAGEHFPCDYVREHEGWAHSSRAAQAIWTCS
jgi:hypothetical protein